MGKVALEVAPDARQVTEIAGLAVAVREARKDAENLGVALGAERGVGEAEGVLIEARVCPGVRRSSSGRT